MFFYFQLGYWGRACFLQQWSLQRNYSWVHSGNSSTLLNLSQSSIIITVLITAENFSNKTSVNKYNGAERKTRKTTKVRQTKQGWKNCESYSQMKTEVSHESSKRDKK